MGKTNDKIDMTNGPLLAKIIFFTLPIMASGMLQLLFNAADTIVVGKYAGDTSLAAVGSTGSLINLTVNLFIGMSVGANVCAAQFFGAGHDEDVSKTLHTSVAFSLICGVALLIIGNITAPIMLRFMGSPSDVIGLATVYVRIYFLAMPATVLYNYLAGILRAAGDTKHPLYFLTIAGVVNVILNLLLVIVFNMGVAGVGIATVVAQYISCILMTAYMMKQSGPMKLCVSKIRIDKKILKKVIRIGLPAGIQGTVFSLSNVVIQSAVNSFGSQVIAGSAAASTLEGFVYMAMNSFQQTAVTFTGQNYGANKADRVRQVMWKCLMLVTIVGLILGNLVYFNGTILLGLFTSGQGAIAAGLIRLRWVCCFYFLCGIMDVMTGMLRGVGRSTLPMIVSIIGACGLRLVWIFTYFQFNHTQDVLFFAYPMSWAITFSAHCLCFYMVYREWKKKIDTNFFYV